MSILEVKNVSKFFGGVKANVDISMSVEKGKIVGLIGPNGSGKTTLFNSIVGTYPIDQGSIKFNDKEVSELPVPVIAKLGLLRTFQQTRIYGKLNCVENMLISHKASDENLLKIFSQIPKNLTEKAESLLNFVVNFFEKSNKVIGEYISWFIIFMVIIQLTIVMARYIFGIGFLKLQELLIYLHGLSFTLAAGYTLLNDEHVRVDLIYRASSNMYKSIINILGSLFFLIPFCLITYSTSLPYVQRSWKIFEGSPETSGLNAVFLLKTALIIFPLLLLIQAVSIIYRNIKKIIESKN